MLTMVVKSRRLVAGLSGSAWEGGGVATDGGTVRSLPARLIIEESIQQAAVSGVAQRRVASTLRTKVVPHDLWTSLRGVDRSTWVLCWATSASARLIAVQA